MGADEKALEEVQGGRAVSTEVAPWTDAGAAPTACHHPTSFSPQPPPLASHRQNSDAPLCRCGEHKAPKGTDEPKEQSFAHRPSPATILPPQSEAALPQACRLSIPQRLLMRHPPVLARWRAGSLMFAALARFCPRSRPPSLCPSPRPLQDAQEARKGR